jgi:hypothetical protein
MHLIRLVTTSLHRNIATIFYILPKKVFLTLQTIAGGMLRIAFVGIESMLLANDILMHDEFL